RAGGIRWLNQHQEQRLTRLASPNDDKSYAATLKSQIAVCQAAGRSIGHLTRERFGRRAQARASHIEWILAGRRVAAGSSDQLFPIKAKPLAQRAIGQHDPPLRV